MSTYTSINLCSGSDAAGDHDVTAEVTSYNNLRQSGYNMLDPENPSIVNGVSMTPEERQMLIDEGYFKSKKPQERVVEEEEPQQHDEHDDYEAHDVSEQTLSISDDSSEVLSVIHDSVGSEGYDSAVASIAEALVEGEELGLEVADALADALGIDIDENPEALEDGINDIIDEARLDAGQRMMDVHGMEPDEVMDFAQWVYDSGHAPKCFAEGSRGMTTTLDKLAKHYMNGSY